MRRPKTLLMQLASGHVIYLHPFAKNPILLSPSEAIPMLAHMDAAHGTPTVWEKLDAVVKYIEGGVVTVFTEAEKEVLALVSPLLRGAETSALAALKGELVTFLKGFSFNGDLGTAESEFISFLDASKRDLLPIATGLGSQVLQAMIGLAIKELTTASASA